MTSRVGEYMLRETLGTGAFGKVRHAIHQTTGKHYAIKVMDKFLIHNQELTINVRREIAIMKAFSHPNIVSLHTVLTSKTKLYVVLDLVQGPELFEVIANRGPGGLPENEARKYFQNLIDGVDYCHRRGVCHRDLKPENLLIDQHANLKITDFGLSSMKGANTTTDLLTTQCGTPNYIAPEIISCLNPRYDGQKVDVWACGIILFALLAGYLPFDETDLAHLFEVIQNGQIEFPPWFSSGARELIWRLLCVDPETRASVHDVKQHPWFLVDYQPCPRTGATASAARRRRRRSRASNSDDNVRIEATSMQTAGQQKPNAQMTIPGTFDIPQTPMLSMELPSLQLPAFQRPAAAMGPTVNMSITAAAAAETARTEMLRSRRAMSFSKKYSLLRKGTVTYGGLEIGVGSFRGPRTLGGEHQARLRGVLSTHDSLPVSQCDEDVIINANEASTENAEASGASGDDVNEQHATMNAIRSLRNVISTSRTRLREAGEVCSSDEKEEAQLRESTLCALRKLRFELQTAESQCSKESETQVPRYSPRCASIMSPSRMKDTIRLLDVWESRMLSDFLSGNGSDDTRVTEQEILAFQSLLQAWETHLGGEDWVEDVLIPGSEVVEDESPAATVPERFLDTRNFLQRIECRRKDCERDPAGVQGKNRISLASWSIPLHTEGSEVTLCSSSNLRAAQLRNVGTCSSAQPGGDLTELWNHVLVENTSQLDASEENSNSPAQRTVVTAEKFKEEPASSPVTDFHPSPHSTEGVEILTGDTTRDMGRSRASSRSSGVVSPKCMETYCLPPSPPASTETHRQSLELRDSLHPGRTSEDGPLLKSIKSHDFVHEPPLVRSHAKRQIRVDSVSSRNEMEPLSSGNLGVNQAENDNRSGSERAKIEQRKSGDLPAGHINSLRAVARKYKFLHIRSKYTAQFESGYDARTCLRELGRMMEKQGIDVTRRQGHKMLRVRVPGPRNHQEFTASFDFRAKGQSGSVVNFKRITGDRSISRSEEEDILSTFLRKVLDQFGDSEPGFAVLTEYTS